MYPDFKIYEDYFEINYFNIITDKMINIKSRGKNKIDKELVNYFCNKLGKVNCMIIFDDIVFKYNNILKLIEIKEMSKFESHIELYLSEELCSKIKEFASNAL